MQVAIISPISQLHQFSAQGDIEMCLAHLCVDKDYKQYYQQKAKEGKFVILDNGLYENKTAMPAKQLLDVALEVGAKEVIAPDALLDSKQTIFLVFNFISLVIRKNLRNKFRIMAVPQADNYKEWWYCYQSLSNLQDVDTIGLSKLSIPYCFRTPFIPSIYQTRNVCCGLLDFLQPTKPHHLLGGDCGLAFELSVQKFRKWIRSCDSSAPVWYGHLGYTFGNDGIIKLPDRELPAINFEEKILNNIEMINYNIKIIQEGAKLDYKSKDYS